MVNCAILLKIIFFTLFFMNVFKNICSVSAEMIFFFHHLNSENYFETSISLQIALEFFQYKKTQNFV